MFRILINSILIILIVLKSSHQQPPLCSISSSSSCLPCSLSCKYCFSGQQCTTCASQYYAISINGSLSCLPCGDYCLACTDQTSCTECQNPFVLVNNKCLQCQIPNALECSNTVSASKCIDNYYVGDNYCHNCLLHCQQCLGNSDCQTCDPGYTLNTTIQVCNKCQTGCKTCNSLIPVICISCYPGYKLSDNSCSLISCSINNCKYCSTTGTVCDQCQFNYFWDSSTTQCIFGSSVLCFEGAIGRYSSDCINTCGPFAFTSFSYSSKIQCTPYKNIDLNSVSYKQYYYYAFNDYTILVNSLAGTSNPLTFQSSISQYSYDFRQLQWSQLAAYYRIDFLIKYIANTEALLNLTATTETETQSETMNLASSAISIKSYTTLSLHSNNLRIQSNGTSVKIIELYFRLSVCPAGCDRCLNQQLCELCTAPQYMLGYKCVENCTVYYHLTINRTCVVSCPNTYYHSTIGLTNKICQPCISPCVDCISQAQCLSCVSLKFLLGYNCLDQCPNGYFGFNGKCQVCISPCKTCTSQSVCLSCNQGFWNGTNCTAFCSQGTFGNELSKTCQTCLSPCVTCRNSSNFCTSCAENIFLHNFQCLNQCPTRYYGSGKLCIPCSSPCFTCSDANTCLSCSFNFLNATNGQCISNCGVGKYGDLILRTCVNCNSECKTCRNANGCTLCKDNSKCLYGVSCLSQCPSDAFYGLISLSTVLDTGSDCFCKQCNFPCKTCSDSSQCLSCLSGYLFQDACVTQCPSSYYTNSVNFECALCSNTFSQCLSCTQNSCLVCSNNFFLHNGRCVNSCPSMHYQSNRQCFKCIAPCEQCTSFTLCTTCISPYIKYNTGCIIQCPIGTINQNDTCLSCTSPCLTCSSSLTKCTICIAEWFLDSSTNTCTENCSSLTPIFSFYQEPLTSSCSACMFPCETCTSQTFCKSCRIGYLTQITGKCKDCSPGTYTSPDKTQCIGCPTQCTTCVSAIACTACKQNYYLYMNACTNNVSLCQQNGYYASGRVCQPCRAPCEKCTRSATTCTTCLTGYIFFTNSTTNLSFCISDCPTGYFRNSSVCSTCAAECTDCITSETYCLSCTTPYLLHLATMSCITLCPNGTYQSGTLCVVCKYPCRNCISQQQCLSCVSGTLINQKCFSVCPNGQFINFQSECQVCLSPCKQCHSSPTNCTQCVIDTYLLNNTCLGQCPASYFPQQQSLQCLQCSSNCKQCTDNINCTACNSDKIFFYNNNTNYAQCVIDCPQGFYKINDISGSSTFKCQNCKSDCLTCTNGTECALCKNNKVQHNGQCFDQCPFKMYPFEGVCQSCTPPCLECTDSFTCTSCINSSYLLLGFAQCIEATACPQNYYLLASASQCNTQCPSGYYHNNDRTCNQQGCGDNQFKGNNFYCYTQCPTQQIGNKTYFCNSCVTGQQCSGLYFDVSSQVKRDELTFIISFTQIPVYKVNQPAISIQPNLNHQIISDNLTSLQGDTSIANLNSYINPNYMTSVTPYNGQKSLIVRINPTQSIPQTIFTISFTNSFATFDNPLQMYTKNIDFPGYDMFDCASTILVESGMWFLVIAIIGVFSKFQTTDFAQTLFFLALLNIHYPCHLAEFVEATAIAHLHKFVSVEQSADMGTAKFSYVATMGLLSNALPMFIVLAVGLIIGIFLFFVRVCLKKKLAYNKVGEQSQSQINKKEGQTLSQKKKRQQASSQQQQREQLNQIEQAAKQKEVQQTCAYKAYMFLNQLFGDFRIRFINRWIYFTFSTISLFTFSQLWALNFTNSVDLISSVMALLLVFLMPIYAASFLKDHPKLTFLYARKLLLALSVVLSNQNPIYIVGVMSVCNLTAGILIYSYKLEAWKIDTRILLAGQLSQFILQILIAVYVMVPSGSFTTSKLLLSWAIYFTIVTISFFYLFSSFFQIFLYGAWLVRGVDYKQMWIEEDQNKEDTVNDSQSQNSSMKQNQSKKAKKEQIAANITLSFFKNDKMLGKDIEKGHEEESASSNSNGPYGGTGDLFWTYNDMDNQGEDRQKRPPKMLVRCVNEFSDYNKSQKSGRNDQQEQQQN